VDTETRLAVPPCAELVMAQTIDEAWDWYHSAAEQSLEDAVFESDGEHEAEVARIILSMVDTMDTVSDNVRQRAIGVIAKYKLYHATPEGQDSLREMIHDALPEMQSGAMSEHLAIAEVIMPYCETHGIPARIPPHKLGYLREAASALRQVIQNPELPSSEKAEAVEAELEWLFQQASARREVRDRYRSYRGVPARATNIEHDDMTYIIIEAVPATAAAIRQRLGRLADWDRPGIATVAIQGETRQSKIDPGQMVVDTQWIITLTRTALPDRETGW